MELSKINTYTTFVEGGRESRVSCLFTTVGLDVLEPSDILRGVTAINPDGKIITGIGGGIPNFTPSDYFAALDEARQTGILQMDSPVIPTVPVYSTDARSYFNVKTAVLPYVQELKWGTILWRDSNLETLSMERLTSITYSALEDCRNLTELYAPNLRLTSQNYDLNWNNGLYASKLVLGSMSSYEWRGNCLFSGDTLIRAFRDIDLESITLTTVESGAFQHLAYLSNLYISENFNVLNNSKLMLSTCLDLERVIFPNFSGSISIFEIPKLMELNIPKAYTDTTIFSSCKNLQSLTIGGNRLNSYALSGLQNLTYLSGSKITTLHYNTPFGALPDNAVIHLPNIQYVANYCFNKNFNFTDETVANFWNNIKSLGSNNYILLGRAFNFTEHGSDIFELPNCEYWYPELESNFNTYISSGIRVFNLPKCLSMGNMSYKNIEEVLLPVCSRLTGSQFASCTALQKVSIPACQSIGSSAFYSCPSLSTLDLPVCSYIGSRAFAYCSSLMTLILRSTSICSLYNSDVFSGTPMRTSTYTGSFGSIYVPVSLISDYKAASYWSLISDRFGTIEDLENEESE